MGGEMGKGQLDGGRAGQGCSRGGAKEQLAVFPEPRPSPAGPSGHSHKHQPWAVEMMGFVDSAAPGGDSPWENVLQHSPFLSGFDWAVPSA